MANKTPKRTPASVAKTKKNQYVTKNGTAIKLHRSLSERYQAHRDAKLARKAEKLKDLPKSRVKRFFYRLHPKRLYHYWFSREGALMALKIVGVGIVVVFIMLVGVFAYFRKDLPNITDISGSNIGGSITYYDRTGKTVLWQDYDAVKRIPVQSDQISTYMKEATVAVEDKDFYKHGGFDVRGIMRAGFNDLKGGSTQGGSTITQQLVKLTQDWTKDRTITRKVKEVILSVELERTYTKDEILTGYLNTAPYGNIENGVQAAAQDYFHKNAKDITLPEAAFLAAIPKSPSYYSPYVQEYFNKPALVGRTEFILDKMVETGKITKKQADEAKKVDVVATVQPQQSKYNGIKSPYFVLAAKSELEDIYGAKTVNRGGWKVITTMNADLQALADKAVIDDLPVIHRYGGDEAAFAAQDIKTGQMVALVGGVNFDDPDHGKINYAHDAMIPPGSSFKPYDYTSLIENTTNFGAGSVLYDTQGPITGYACTNKNSPKSDKKANCLWDYDFRYPGPLTLRYALGGSRNVPAVKAMLTVGVDKTINTADALMNNPTAYNCYADEKLTRTTQCYGASAIGDGAFLHLDDHVNGLASLGRLGNAIPRTYILSITDAAGKTIKKWEQPKGKQVVRPDSAYIVNDMASDPNASYLPSSYKFQRYKGWNFAVKTGTTNDAYDGLMASWSTQYAAISWVGYHTRNKAMTGAMEYMTEPITRTWMQGAHDRLGTTPTNWVKPAGVKTAAAFVVKDHVGIGSVEPSPSTDLFPSWYVGNKTTNNQPVTIDQVSNKLATECTPDRAKKILDNSNANAFSGDTFVQGGGGSAPTDKDDVHQCTDSRPSITIANAPSSCNGSCTITVNVSSGTHPLSSDAFKGTVNVVINGQIVQSFEVDNAGTIPLNFSFGGTGSQDVTVQVIDSVLYDDSSEAQTINFLAPQALSLSETNLGKRASFTWNNNINGASTYKVCWTGPSSGCSPSTAGDSYTTPTVPILPNGSYTATVQTDTGLSSNQVSFKIT